MPQASRDVKRFIQHHLKALVKLLLMRSIMVSWREFFSFLFFLFSANLFCYNNNNNTTTAATKGPAV